MYLEFSYFLNSPLHNSSRAFERKSSWFKKDVSFPDRSAAYFQCTEVHTSVHFGDTLLLMCIALHSKLHCSRPPSACTSEVLQCTEVLHCKALQMHCRCAAFRSGFFPLLCLNSFYEQEIEADYSMRALTNIQAHR